MMLYVKILHSNCVVYLMMFSRVKRPRIEAKLNVTSYETSTIFKSDLCLPFKPHLYLPEEILNCFVNVGLLNTLAIIEYNRKPNIVGSLWIGGMNRQHTQSA